MLNIFAMFAENEDGAVTIDWVVLTAALVGMGVFVGLYIADPVKDIDSNNGQALNSIATDVGAQVITVDFSGSGS